MGKLRLDLDQLHVESFAADEQERERGTVQGNADVTPNNTCVMDFCPNTGTSGCSCAVTCANTCPNTCQTCSSGVAICPD